MMLNANVNNSSVQSLRLVTGEDHRSSASYEKFDTNCVIRNLFCFPVFRFWAYLMKVILGVPDEGYSERTWWRLFWTYLMKVILSVPDEGYSERTWWRLFWAYLMKVIQSLPDEGNSERTWWRLFWAYLMKVILSVPDEGNSEST